MMLLRTAPHRTALHRTARKRGCSALLGRSHWRALVSKSRRRIERKKNAAEAALKIWRHPSMKESLLAVGSIVGMTQKIQYELRN